jgi:protocatechuate 3,4-dioxygenase alpha subunit
MQMLTPFQTAGPFLSLGLPPSSVSLDTRAGDALVVRGRLLDGAGAGIPDGVVECWHVSLPAVCRALTADDGSFAITTTRPEAVPGPGGSVQAPHLAVRVLGRGILTEYVTRMYFPDEPRNVADPILNLVPHERRHTLLGTRVSEHEYRFDLVVQGNNETVFFDV